MATMNLSDLNVSHSGVKYADFRRKKKFLIQFGIHKFDFSTRLSKSVYNYGTFLVTSDFLFYSITSLPYHSDFLFFFLSFSLFFLFFFSPSSLIDNSRNSAVFHHLIFTMQY